MDLVSLGVRMPLVRLDEYPLEHLGLEEGTLDGPFLMADGSFGLLVSLRSKDGAMPTPGELHWRRDVPPRVITEGVHLFLRQGAAALYLGRAEAAQRGKPERDGFRIAFGLEEPLTEASWCILTLAANGPPPPAPEEAIAALAHGSTTAERMAAMRVFLERWFDLPAAPAPSSPPFAPLPLRSLHGVLAGRDVCVQNRLVMPDHLVVEDGKVVFYVENQGVCAWATAAGGDDPPVLVRQNERGAPWEPESDSLSGFLLQMLVLEAVLGAPFGASQEGVDARSLARVMQQIAPLPVGGWAASRTRFIGGKGVIGFAQPNGEDYDVWLGAKDRARLEPLEPLIGEWESVGF
jgi:hypothetical protein